MNVRLLFAASILLLPSGQTFAGEVKHELDEVVVTASRVKEKVKEAPVAISVVSKQEIENVKPRNSEEVMKRIPGVNSSNLGGESTITSIRIPTHFTNPYTLLLVDGVPVSGYGSGGSSGFSELNFDNIASVEVVKGPGSALYGSNAIGGIINVITKDPVPGQQVKVWSELGDNSQWRSGLTGSSSGDKLSFNASLNYINSDNWREHSAVDKKTGNIKLNYVPNDQSLVTFKLDYINFDNESTGTLKEDDFNEDWQQSYHTFTYAELEKIAPVLSYSHYFNEAELKTTLAYRTLDHEVLPNYSIRPQGRGRYVGSLSEISDNDVNLQLLYNQPIEFMQSKVVAGIDFERGNSETDTYSLSVDWDSMLNKYTDYTKGSLSKSYDVTTNVWAPYVQFQTKPVEKLGITAGGRFDSLEYEVDDKLGTGDSGDMDFSEFSPKVGVTYDFTPTFNSYVSYSEGFVVPTTSQLFTSSWANSDLDPEKAKNYEVGVRTSFMQHKIGLDVALYSMKIEDKIVTKDINSYVKQYVNAGETSQEGIEIAATIRPVEYATLTMAYTYANNEYEEYIDGGVDYSGNTIERSPKHRLIATLGAEPLQNLWVELEMDAISSQYSDAGNVHEYSRPTLFNLRAQYDWNEWAFWAHVLNLTDQEYASYVSYSSSDDTTTYLSGTPRSFIAGISYKWGGVK